ncbi:thiamine diphosphokinase [Hominifimenecus sp. rT4P-3]|uniref:thiamine diphosphokinase n=1 Tax=Hominifimenecus sp. rT4P-3 TaxID=3242979 RepID=UPI003DA2577A
MGICYIVGAGDFGDGTIVPGPEDLVIAGDGGFRHLRDRGIRVDFAIGDFDSLGYRPGIPDVMVLKPEKDDTDMMAALEEGIRRGYREFKIYGGTGGRISHTIANIQMMAGMAKRGLRAELIGFGCRMWVIQDSEIRFQAGEKGFLSVFCLGDAAEGVTEEGLKYSLSDYRMVKENPLGVSNEFTGKPSLVRVKKGTLLLIWEEKRC